MGVYACLPISLLLFLLIFQTLSNASSIEYESLASNSNQSINSLPLQHHHHHVLVRPREGGGGGGGGGGGEENRTAAEWVVLRAKGGRAGGVGGSNINHRPGKPNKNAAPNLLNSKITLLPLLLLTFYFYPF